MDAYFRLLSTPVGRGLRLVSGLGLVVAGVFWDRYGSPSWLLILPGALFILTSLLNLCLPAPLFGLPLCGGDLHKHDNRKAVQDLNDLTFVGESIRRHSYPANRD